jgi:hypothetical protein
MSSLTSTAEGRDTIFIAFLGYDPCPPPQSLGEKLLAARRLADPDHVMGQRLASIPRIIAFPGYDPRLPPQSLGEKLLAARRLADPDHVMGQRLASILASADIRRCRDASPNRHHMAGRSELFVDPAREELFPALQACTLRPRAAPLSAITSSTGIVAALPCACDIAVVRAAAPHRRPGGVARSPRAGDSLAALRGGGY